MGSQRVVSTPLFEATFLDVLVISEIIAPVTFHCVEPALLEDKFGLARGQVFVGQMIVGVQSKLVLALH